MKKILLAAFLLFLSSYIFSQEIKTDPFENRIIQKHYTKAELKIIETDHFEKFKQIRFLFIHSFTIDAISAAACLTFNPELFDVMEYEKFRLTERSVTITINVSGCAINITLISKKELDLLVLHNGLIPIELIPEK